MKTLRKISIVLILLLIVAAPGRADSTTWLNEHAAVGREVGVAPGEYTVALPFVSHPSLSWNTFLGGDGIDDGLGTAVDNDGNLYVVGTGNVGWGAPVAGHHGGDDVFVAKLSGEGALLWHTFVGGSGQDNGAAIAVDGAGNTYIVGTSTATFGTPIHPFIGGYDICIAKVTTQA